jgi:TusA-related sulfurtransferase
MAVVNMDARGLRCPIPILNISMKVMKKEVVPGDTLEVVADCPTFAAEVRKWCEQSKKVLVFLRDEGNGVHRAQIRI